MRYRAILWPCLIGLFTLMAVAPADAEHGDIVFTRKSKEGSEYPPATFPHYVHRIQFKCFVCHDNIFEMKAGADPVTMDAIGKGKYCGVCHNATIAFGATFESCQRCHQ